MITKDDPKIKGDAEDKFKAAIDASPKTSAWLEGAQMANLKDLKNRIEVVKIDAQDHQGHADGRGGETAPRARGCRSRAPLCRTHGA